MYDTKYEPTAERPVNAQIRFASITAGIALAVMAVLAPLGVMVALPSGSTGTAGLAVVPHEVVNAEA
ncbi:hypothetical protein [Mycetocola reblochoni]|uniref:hypothetical protein n=1 Tax=Mycetocola reblochoni TaxID=331618 RepID=UPI003F997D02